LLIIRSLQETGWRRGTGTIRYALLMDCAPFAGFRRIRTQHGRTLLMFFYVSTIAELYISVFRQIL
jgi:hypothetical protein